MRRRGLALVLVVSAVALAASLTGAVAPVQRTTAPAGTTEWSLTSPDTRTSIIVTRHPDGRLSWRATRAGVTVITPSPLGVRRLDQQFVEGLTFVRATPIVTLADQYQMPHGKRRQHRVSGRERTL